MGAAYYQFCPVAKAMELLDERWTLLVIRELLAGSQRFNELRRGLPRMSPTLLSARLQQLVRLGVVERRAVAGTTLYVPTPAGEELRPVIRAIGEWGARWIGELGDADLDPKLLLWDMHRNVDGDRVPPGLTVVQFHFTDVTPRLREWWLVIDSADVDVCDSDPGFPVSVAVTARLRTLTEVWRGDRSWNEAVAQGLLEVAGPARLRRGLPSWFTLSPFARTARPATTAG